MNLSLKVLSLALLTAFAFGVVAASASAETLDHFTSEIENQC
jgi:hypothetical protein